jgi:phage terminase small subunit
MSSTDKLTPKQERFCLLYIELGNAAEAYRRAYACANMAPGSIHREASLLASNPKVTQRLAQLRSQAADKAVLDKSWVLERLKQNVEVSLAERTLTLKVHHRDKETGVVTVSEVEVSAHDAQAANRGLELLARTLGLFEIDNSQQGAAAGAAIAKEMSDFEAARRIAFLFGRAAGRQDDKTNPPPVGQPGEAHDAVDNN